MHDKKPIDDPTPKLKNSRATVAGGNTDGKNLFMEIDVFDGEHTARDYGLHEGTYRGESEIAYGDYGNDAEDNLLGCS
jgi:hypothetical protein